MRRALAIALAVLSLAIGAHAQERSARDLAEAKSLFERGKSAMSAGRFAEARDLFQRSLDLVPKASAAFNLAVALRGMGKPKESHALLARMLRGELGDLPDDMRAQASELAREARRDIAKLTITARGAARIELRVDGARVGTLAPGRALTIDVNPGERVLSFSARARDPVERRITIAPGQSESVSATLELSRAARRSTLTVIAKDPAHEVEIEGIGKTRGKIERRLDPGRYVIRLHAPDGTRESSVELEPATQHRVELEPPAPGLLSSPWFWAAAGAVVVGGAIGGYLLLQDRETEPVRDPEFGVTETLRWR